jgi:hypothetical protein
VTDVLASWNDCPLSAAIFDVLVNHDDEEHDEFAYTSAAR